MSIQSFNNFLDSPSGQYLLKSAKLAGSGLFAAAGSNEGYKIYFLAKEVLSQDPRNIPYLDLASLSFNMLGSLYASYRLFTSVFAVDNSSRRYIPRMLRPVTQMAPSQSSEENHSEIKEITAFHPGEGPIQQQNSSLLSDLNAVYDPDKKDL